MMDHEEETGVRLGIPLTRSNYLELSCLGEVARRTRRGGGLPGKAVPWVALSLSTGLGRAVAGILAVGQNVRFYGCF
jgi:hypothetical protein